MRYITVSLNPALDRTVFFKKFEVGELNRSTGVSLTAGSKGVNVARCLKTLGAEVLSVAFSGGSTGEFFESEIKGAGIESKFIRAASPVRENIKIIEESGRCTEANESGGPYSPAEVAEITDFLTSEADKNTCICLCGSLPQGVEKSYYRDIIPCIRKKGAFVALDCDGEALRLGIESRPNIIKPNAAELSRLAGESVGSVEDAARISAEISAKYGVSVVTTLSENGSVCASKGEIYFATAPKNLTVRGFAGAGDTYLAAFLYKLLSEKAQISDCLAFAASASGAKITCPGTELPPLDGLGSYENEITVTKI